METIRVAQNIFILHGRDLGSLFKIETQQYVPLLSTKMNSIEMARNSKSCQLASLKPYEVNIP